MMDLAMMFFMVRTSLSMMIYGAPHR